MILDALIGEITAAFNGVGLEDGVILSEARALNDYESEEVTVAARLKDTEDRWQDVADDKLRELSDVHVFLCPKAYRFYIPAFMIWTLRHLDDENGDHSGLNWSTLYSFDPSVTHYSDRFNLLSRQQNQAVCRFLRYLARHSEWDREDAERYLQQHWGSFCPAEDDAGSSGNNRVM